MSACKLAETSSLQYGSSTDRRASAPSVSLVNLILEIHRARWTCGPYRPIDGTWPAGMPVVCPFGLV